MRFANGTIKQIQPDGQTIVQFANGDVKKQMPCGKVDYYYKQVDTWHTTLPSGVEVSLSFEHASVMEICRRCNVIGIDSIKNVSRQGR